MKPLKKRPWICLKYVYELAASLHTGETRAKKKKLRTHQLNLVPARIRVLPKTSRSVSMR